MTKEEFNTLCDLTEDTCKDLLCVRELKFNFLYGDFSNQSITVFFSEEKEEFPGIMRKLFNRPVIEIISHRFQIDANELQKKINSAKKFIGYLREKINKVLEG